MVLGAFEPESKTYPNADKLRIAIVHAQWNSEVVNALVEGAEKTLKSHGVTNITIKQVPGSFELPFACMKAINNELFDAVIAIGVLIKGETMHFEYIADSVSNGLMKVGLDTGKPVIFGVLTCLTQDQAKARAGIEVKNKSSHNHGIDWAISALEMITNWK